MLYQQLGEYLDSLNISSTSFMASTGDSAGYLRLKNSGKRGEIKEFALSFDSIISGLEDIKDNLPHFQTLQRYNETEWRDASLYFKDVSLKSLITVQTKPVFCTLSKVICWANNINYNNDNYISITNESLVKTIEKLTKLTH